MTSRLAAALVLGAAALSLPQAARARAASSENAAPEARPFDRKISEAGAAALIDRALAQAGADSTAPRKVLAVFGANWCHDSRGLAGWLLDARHAAMLGRDFVTVFVDVGKPQDGKGRNLALLERFGIKALKSTPALVVLDNAGQRLNSIDEAVAWRHAASRSDAAIAEAVAGYAGRSPAT